MPRPHPVLVELAAGRPPRPPADADDGLLDSARAHGMHGLLWSWVHDHAPAYSERAALAGADVATRQRHARLWETLVTVRRTLADLGVDIAAIKGVTAEARWYERAGERPCTDVDVLVDPAASSRAAEIVDSLHPGHFLRDQILDLVRTGHMQSVNLRVDDMPVDLHFDLFKLGIPTRQQDVVWGRMQDFGLPDGSTVRVPDAELALVNFLVHMNKDSFPVLLGFADVARILRSEALGGEPLDWAFIDQFLRREGLDVIGYCSLATVGARLGLSTPRGAPTAWPRTLMWRAVWPERTVLLGGAGAHRSRRQDLLPFLVRGRGTDALRWIGRIALPRSETVALRYPEIPGPYLWRLTKGRFQTARARKQGLRARHAREAPLPQGSAPTSNRAPAVTARLLHARARAEPLWVDVRGESMGWSIPSGVRVRVEPADLPKRGEVWAFCDDRGEIVVHRFHRTVDDRFQFQGDTCVRADDGVDPEQLIGRVVELDPPRATLRWGPIAGSSQRLPRLAVAATVRAARRGRARTRG